MNENQREQGGFFMRNSRIGRMSTVAVAGLVSIGGVVTFALPAQAAFVGIKCKTLTGSDATGGTVTLSNCSGNTGGSSTPLSISALAAGGTITWTNGKTTTLGTPTLSGETDTAKDALKGSCPAGTTETEAKGAVTADTTGSAPVPGKYSLEVCVANSPGTSITNEKGSAVKIG
jgi:hypothetical protein